MPGHIGRMVIGVAIGLLRATTFAACALIIPICVALLPTLAALRILGSPWSWSNPWTWLAMVIITGAVTLALAHPVAFLFRSLIARWAGIRIPAGFRERPQPIRLSTGFWWNGSSYERTRKDAEVDLRMQRLKEPAYWREVRWAAIAAVVIAVPCAAPITALIIGVIMIIGDTSLVIMAAVPLLVLGAVLAALCWRIVRPVAARFLAAPAGATPTAGELRTQRADLTAAHDAEIRRIERDLHDGAQARLVAVGLDLAVAERLIRSDPDRAEQLLRSAKIGTSASLTDLRELVHGVYPSVLIERGLVPAIRERALESPIDVTIDGPDDLHLPSPMAAALYFSVCELLANIAKHAHATDAEVMIMSSPSTVTVVVRDNGSGGASPRAGGGLDGVHRRLAVFDATLGISSPTGGPTEITVKVPCE